MNRRLLALFFVLPFFSAHLVFASETEPLPAVLRRLEGVIFPEMAGKFDEVIESNWNVADPYVRRVLDTYRVDLDALRSADLPKFFSAPIAGDRARVSFSSVRNLARLFLSQARIHEKNGKLDESMKDCVYVMTWGRLLAKDVGLVSFMMAVTVKQMAFVPTKSLLGEPGLTPLQRAALGREIRLLVDEWPSLAKPLDEEKAAARRILQSAFTEELNAKPKSAEFIDAVRSKTLEMTDHYFDRLKASTDPGAIDGEIQQRLERARLTGDDRKDSVKLEKRYKKSPQALRGDLIESIALLYVQTALPDTKQAARLNGEALEKWKSINIERV